MGYSFDFDNMMQFDEDKLPDKFKMPHLQKFGGTRDPRIYLSQYITTMSTTKAPMYVVARLFVLSLEGMAVNWYHGLEKSVRADWRELCSTFLKQYKYNIKLEVSIRDLELTKQRPNESFSNSLIDTSSFVFYSYCFRKVEHNSFQSAGIDISNPWYQLTAMPSKDSTNNLATTDIGVLVVLIVVMY